MKIKNRWSGLGALTLVLSAALIMGACSGAQTASNKAGGPADPVVLTIANTYSDLNNLPAVQYFVSQVKVRSDGNLRIETMDSYGNGSADSEQQAVRAVANGTVDLGWAATRVSTPWVSPPFKRCRRQC